MPKQLMRVKEKRHCGPESPHVSSQKQRNRAFIRGDNAWKAGFFLSDNPYRPGLERDAWAKGYAQAANWKPNLVTESAPAGKWHLEPNSYVVVKRTGASKKVRSKQEFNPEKEREKAIEAKKGYLGYIKPGKNGRLRKFRVYTRNPSEDKWKNKVACKSYKEPKDEELA
jgi:hypothetical protein